MYEKRWLTTVETMQSLAGISKSTLHRRTKDLNLVERGYVLKFGRRVLYSSRLISDLPALLDSKIINGECRDV
jgi:hypothetical protein